MLDRVKSLNKTYNINILFNLQNPKEFAKFTKKNQIQKHIQTSLQRSKIQ